MFGFTRQNLPILGYEFSNFANSAKKIFILGGVHGDEVEGVACAFGLVENLLQSFPFRLHVTVVPAFNLDGVLAKTRTNAAGVDLNRNLPTKDWNPKILNVRYPPGPSANSEPENQALVGFMKNQKLDLIVSLHSYHPVILVNGNCRKEAEILKKWTGVEVREDIGYPTPGSLGTYGGVEGRVPTITYEIERGMKLDRVVSMHVPALLELFKYLES